jgi:hypothetical protein
MTLFDAVAPEQPAFRAVLERFYGGEADPLTLKEIGARRSALTARRRGDASPCVRAWPLPPFVVPEETRWTRTET